MICLVFSCVPVPEGQRAIIQLRGHQQFPFVILDFGSASLYLQALNGEKTAKFGWVEIPAGTHEIVIAVSKGPTGFFGTAPILGTCRAKIKVDLPAGSSWEAQYIRKENADFISMRNSKTKEPLLEAPCLP